MIAFESIITAADDVKDQVLQLLLPLRLTNAPDW